MQKDRGRRSLPPPETIEEALARSLQHARNSASEALLATRALMDALSILLANEPVARHAQPNSPIANLAGAIERWAGTLRGPEPDRSSPGLPEVLGALEIEIDRWARRSQNDPNARTVLHAFIGMREILWEFDPPVGRSVHPRSARRKQPVRSAQTPFMDTVNS